MKRVFTKLLIAAGIIIIVAIGVDVALVLRLWEMSGTLVPYELQLIYGPNKTIMLPEGYIDSLRWDLFYRSATPFLVALIILGILLALDVAAILILRKRKRKESKAPTV